MSEQWHTPPWEIVPEKSQLYWLARWQFFEKQRTEAAEMLGK